MTKEYKAEIHEEERIYISEEEYNTMSRAMLVVMYLKDILNMLEEFEL